MLSLCPPKCFLPHRIKETQHGAALLVLLLIVVMALASSLISALSHSELRIERDKVTFEVLAQAKEALIGDSVSPSEVTMAGYLRLPDLGFGPIITTLSEGNAAPNFSGNKQDYSVIGKVPWKRLGIAPLRDGHGECLWYVVSGRFKKTPATDILNWDTQGQIGVADKDGGLMANNIAALLVAPGQPLDGQSHVLADSIYSQCGGNYDARNYLDAYNNTDAVFGSVNYFSGSTNNRVALNINNKKFVMANGEHYNDRVLIVTVEDIFRPIIRRSDFASQVRDLLDDPDLRLQVELGHPKTVAVSGIGSKGADNIVCNNIGNLKNKTFCNNWKEMLLLTQPTTGSCSRVLIFGGQKTASQVRLTIANKADPAQYLESPNLAAFAVPTTNNPNFGGASIFSANNPSADIFRCLP